MTAALRETGIGFVGRAPWGTHLCHFFETKQDLLDTLLPFFQAGLEAREFCLWLVAGPLAEEEATSALRRIVPALDRFLADGSIEIHPAPDWYLGAGVVDHRALIAAWDRKLTQALNNGFAEMRVNASAAWLEEKDWRDFSAYEEKLNEWLADKRMLVVCSYPLATGSAAAILDVARAHNFAIAKRKGTWEVVETPEFREAKEEIKRLNEGLQERVAERTAELEAVNMELRTRHRRQGAVADLGLAAIHATEIRALMDKAAAVAAETLDTEFSAVAELLPEGNEFRVLSGVGWKPGYVGGTVSALGTPGRFMLRSDEPIVTSDLAADTRFERPQVLLEQGVVSLMAVIIRGRTRPWGLLSVHSTRPRTFSPDDVAFLQSVANVLALAVERNEIELAQQREKETLQAIFDNIPVMISVYDVSGRLSRVNREWERVLGWTFEEAQGIDILAAVYPDPERRIEALEFMRQAGRDWVDFRPRTRDGSVIDVSWARFRLSDGSAIGFGIDITARKQDELALRESEARFRQLAENIDEVFWLANLENTEIFYVSPAYERVFGRTRESLYREPRSWLEAVHPEDRARARRTAQERQARGEMDETYRVVRADASIRWIRDRSFPIRDASGQTYRYAGIAEDITARRKAEQELMALSRRLLTAQEEERRRLAVELHDELGQFLTAVKINLASLERQPQAGPAPAHLTDAIASVDRAMERVRDIALDLRPSVLDDLGLPAAIRWYSDRLARSARVEVHLSIDAIPNLPSEVETACFRVAQEALTNVARHARAGNVWVDLHLVADALDLIVRDDGIGFDANAARERAIGGASLGILGMQERVSLVRGEYELKSRPGGGTEVRARFLLEGKAPGVP